MFRSFEVGTDSKGKKYFKATSEGCGCCSDSDEYYGKNARREIEGEIEECESRIARLRGMLNDFPVKEETNGPR